MTIEAQTTRPSDEDERRRDALADRLVAAATATLELYSVHLGRELGLYDALTEPLSYPDLSTATGVAPRYAREWLEQQAVAGLLEVAIPGDAEHRRYVVPAPHRPVLHDAEAATHVAPVADMVAGIGAVLGQVARAYRTGEGVPYAEYGASFRRGQAGMNRPAFADLPEWMAAIPDVAARVHADPVGRIADIGCGEGWSTLALAREFPLAFVDGYDSDVASVEAARSHAAEAGLGERVSFRLVDAADPHGITGPYDLVLVFEALHDLARPLEALRSLRTALAESGVVLVVDERVAGEFTAPGDEVERLMYGWSVTHCLPASLADAPSAGLGTVLRSSTVHALAGTAGYRSSRELPVDNDFFRFYRLDR
ncbi:MAG TPA: methyltransferase domain-containing protein [Nocardioidaceae bacterium]|nr:methyltransferase domain-containing protein [Nocardioidaceae bacterium]HSE72573.1 methyltransferase domain-containing protein [Nocardioidaceae bacterium]